MLTTVTPLPQLFNMPSNAAKPPKFAPYPTLVGTAMTGLLTKPGDNTRQRAFHSGHNDDDIRALDEFEPREKPMEPGDADIIYALDFVAHDFGGNCSFLRDGQITCARADDGDRAGAFATGLFFDGDATGHFMMDGVAEFFAEQAGVFDGDARDEDALLASHEFGGDFNDLGGSFACAENDFGKAFAKRAVGVHLRETEIGDRRSLEGVEHVVAADTAGTELFQQLDGFGFGHVIKMAENRGWVTRKGGGGGEGKRLSQFQKPRLI